jgi:hypothetical protein
MRWRLTVTVAAIIDKDWAVSLLLRQRRKYGSVS